MSPRMRVDYRLHLNAMRRAALEASFLADRAELFADRDALRKAVVLAREILAELGPKTLGELPL